MDMLKRRKKIDTWMSENQTMTDACTTIQLNYAASETPHRKASGGSYTLRTCSAATHTYTYAHTCELPASIHEQTRSWLSATSDMTPSITDLRVFDYVC